MPSSNMKIEYVPQHQSGLTLIVEAVNSVDGSTLMIAPEQEKVLRVLDLVSEQKAYGFQ